MSKADFEAKFILQSDIAVPEHLWGTLNEKLQNETYDIGKFVEFVYIPDERCFACQTTRSIEVEDPTHVFLIDHCWTFVPGEAQTQLMEAAALRQRIGRALCLQEADLPQNDSENAVKLVNAILISMTKHLDRVGGRNAQTGEDIALHFLMDEVGIALQNSLTPNMNMTKIFDKEKAIYLTVIWPKHDIEEEELLSVNRFAELPESTWRCFEWAWNADLSSSCSTPPPPFELEECLEGGEDCHEKPSEKERSPKLLPLLNDVFFSSHRQNEKLPPPEFACSEKADKVEEIRAGQIKVFSDIAFVQNALSQNSKNNKNTQNESGQSARYVLCAQPNQADFIWTYSHFKDYATLAQSQPRTLISQFPFESVITLKDLLAVLARSAAPPPFWFSTALNFVAPHELNGFVEFASRLRNEQQQQQQQQQETTGEVGQLEQLECPCSCHQSERVICGLCYVTPASPQQQQQQQQQCDVFVQRVCAANHTWIVKPWNSARSLDIFAGVCVVRLLHRMRLSLARQPLLISPYESAPVLFTRSDCATHQQDQQQQEQQEEEEEGGAARNVKFDLRYLVFLRSVRPLRAYVMRAFWIRFANKAFRLADWDDYETHFTVMNYAQDSESKMKNMTCEEFIPEFNRQYPNHSWETFNSRVHLALKQLMEIATQRAPPLGIAHNPQSRAMYGVDVIPRWKRTHTNSTHTNSTHTNSTHKSHTNTKCEFHMEPLITEVNFSPDCDRACAFYPEFLSKSLDLLCRDEADPEMFVQL